MRPVYNYLMVQHFIVENFSDYSFMLSELMNYFSQLHSNINKFLA